MAITPEQLEKRRRLVKEKYEKRLKQQETVVDETATESTSPNKKWVRRGVKCKRTEGMLAKLKRMVEIETSTIVPLAVYEERMGKCKPCEYVSEHADGTLFCECCGCPTWTFKIANKLARGLGLSELALGADLQSKNQHAQHTCVAEDPQFTAYEKGKNNGHSS